MKNLGGKPAPPAKPLANAYWVLPGRLLAGEYPGDWSAATARKRVDGLVAAGIDVFIDLTAEHESGGYVGMLRGRRTPAGHAVSYRRLAIPDFGVPTVEGMREILDLVDRALKARHRIYLHCLGGVGRTGLVVGCWLVRHGHTGEEALAEVARLFRTMPKSDFHHNSPESDGQQQFVLAWSAAEGEPPPG
ncbi:MAG: Effector protein hopD2 [Lentisphaerae bacterium ADurb.BinA184]|nr:MAG: Effector protein hopD2 [Lentisphaerae bacterium ADurb.BinA184]